MTSFKAEIADDQKLIRESLKFGGRYGYIKDIHLIISQILCC